MRYLSALLLTGVFAALAAAHFVYVVPAKDGQTVQVVLSENLDPDDAVTMEKVAGLKLTARTADGRETAVPHAAGPHALSRPRSCGRPAATAAASRGHALA